MNGIKYQPPCAVIIGHDEDEPRFGNVLDTYVDGMTVYLEFVPLITVQFLYHYHAYALVMPSNRSSFFIEPKNLLDFHSYGLYKSCVINNSHHYVITRSNIQ